MMNLSDEHRTPKHLLLLYLSWAMFRSVKELKISNNIFVKFTFQQNQDTFINLVKEHNGYPELEVIDQLLSSLKDRLFGNNLWVWDGLYASDGVEIKSRLVSRLKQAMSSGKTVIGDRLQLIEPKPAPSPLPVF
jgi:hypothetical protein